MRLAAALICIALLLPAPAVFAADLEPGTLCTDSPAEDLAVKVRAEAPDLAEGFTAAPHHAGTATAATSPATVRSSGLLWWLLSIVIGQDRMSAQHAEPASP